MEGQRNGGVLPSLEFFAMQSDEIMGDNGRELSLSADAKGSFNLSWSIPTSLQKTMPTKICLTIISFFARQSFAQLLNFLDAVSSDF